VKRKAMANQLYVRAKRPELQRERHAEGQETKKGRDTMFLTEEYLKATMHMKEEETRRAHLISEAREQAQQNRNGRAWHWQIEPGMEDAFQDLQGWLLSSQRDAEMETANSPPQPSAPAEGEYLPAPNARPSARAAGEGRLTSEPEPLAA
jgi:hypothetical protein